MPSPFPGMDPYLETLWHDFHKRFIPAVATNLAAQVLPKYFVLIDENVYVHDLAVQDVESLSYLKVLDRETGALITVVELLSPTNKRPGDHRAQYLSKRSSVLSSTAHLVEIDLLRGGRPLPADDRPECTYSVLVSRAEGRPRAGFWPFGLRDPLPTIPIPLGPDAGDARLDLRAVLDRVYDDAGYEVFLYRRPLVPPLTGADAAWARTLLPAAATGARGRHRGKEPINE